VTDPQAAGVEEAATCYRHPQREAHIRCGRCNRRICPDCMVDASVGFQCPECVREGSRGVREARTRFGGRISNDPGYVTKSLIAINVVCFLIQELSPQFTNRFLLSGNAVTDGEYYRLLTAAFLHGGWLHLGLNMYMLWLIGIPLEAALGRMRFLGVYLVSAVAGTALSYAISPHGFSLGASGAIFGLFGAYVVVARRSGGEIGGLLVLIGINFAYGFLWAGQIDWRAHLGGLIAGTLCALVLVYAPQQRRALVQAGGMAVVLLGVVLMTLMRSSQLG
jgi:membrane associated rhomboid family serine protease